MTDYSAYLAILTPALTLTATALLVMLLDAFGGEAIFAIPTRVVAAGVAAIGFLAAAAAALFQSGAEANTPDGMLRLDTFSQFLMVVFCLGGFLSVLLTGRCLDRVRTGAGELYSLMLFVATGACLMAEANHLIIVFLGLEVLSVAVYPLAGFLRREQRSNEAALKYFLLGAFASAFFLYGIALVYGAISLNWFSTDHLIHPGQMLHALRFETIGEYVGNNPSLSPLFWIGVGLLLIGFCFKAALAPFHMWTPDVYDGSPAPATAFMASVVKAAAFAPFFRFFLVMGRNTETAGTLAAYQNWVTVVACIAILTMTWGNIAAVAEPSLKRMLAYSSVAHAGYITMALVAESPSSLLYYSLVYTLMVVGSFGCLALVRRRSGEEALTIKEWTGIGLRHPWLGAALSIFLFALAGFPPTGGFIGKFYIFRAALEIGTRPNGYVGLVVIALLNSLVSVYYYVRVVAVLYRREPEDGIPPSPIVVEHDTAAAIAIALCAIGILLLGIFPQIVFEHIDKVILS